MILIAGQGQVAVHGLRLFHTLAALRPGWGLEVVAAPARGDRDSATARSVRGECADNGWRLVEDLEECPLTAGDVLLSLQWDRKVLDRHIGDARALNLHFALLPRHRGSSTAYWPIRGRDPVVGVTLHEITEGFDEGPVVAQLSHPLAPFTTSGQLTDLFHQLGCELLSQQAGAVVEGTYTAEPQGPSPDPTHRRSDVDFSALDIADFDHPAEEVRARCLALVSPRHQLPTFEGRLVSSAHVLPVQVAAPPGVVLVRQSSSVTVSCSPGAVALDFAPATAAATT